MKKLFIVFGACIALPISSWGLGPVTELDCAFRCDKFFSGYTASCRSACNNCMGETYSDVSNGVFMVKTKELKTMCPDVSTEPADCRCVETTSYKCAAGYYGTPSLVNQVCSQCPEASDIYTDSARTVRARGTSSRGATSVDKCYLAAGTYYDATGQFTIGADRTCYY